MRTFVLVALLTLAAAPCAVQSRNTCAKMKATTLNLTTQIQYPYNLRIVSTRTLPAGFSADVRGRVNPVGIYNDTEGALEYFYGLGLGDAARNPTNPSRSIIKVTPRYLMCDASQNRVAYSLDIYSGNPANGTLYGRIQQEGTFTFDRAGKVCAYDWTLRRLGLEILGNGNPAQDQISGPKVNNSAAQAAAIQQLCGGIQALCTGNNTQYGGSIQTCVNFLSGITFGSWDNADQNNVVCRQLHILLAAFNPNVHCPHTGETGGGKCVTTSFVQVFEDDFLSCRNP